MRVLDVWLSERHTRCSRLFHEWNPMHRARGIAGAVTLALDHGPTNVSTAVAKSPPPPTSGSEERRTSV